MSKKAYRENMAVYESLRASILSCEERIMNETIYMYVTYFALFAFGFDHRWLFLISFVALIVFQSQINSDRLAIEKASSYIRIFFEEVRDDIHWEQFNKDPQFIKDYSSKVQDIGWLIFKYSSSFLALASIFAMIYSFAQEHVSWSFSIPSIIEMIIALLLCCIVIHVNKKIYVNRGNDEDGITDNMRKFYKIVYLQPLDKEELQSDAVLLEQARNDFKALSGIPDLPQEALNILGKWSKSAHSELHKF